MVDVDFSVKDLHRQSVIISIVSINMEELEWCFRPGPSRSLMINGKQYTFDILEVGIHQTCHARRTPGGNGVVNGMFDDATTLSFNRCLGARNTRFIEFKGYMVNHFEYYSHFGD